MPVADSDIRVMRVKDEIGQGCFAWFQRSSAGVCFAARTATPLSRSSGFAIRIAPLCDACASHKGAGDFPCCISSSRDDAAGLAIFRTNGLECDSGIGKFVVKSRTAQELIAYLPDERQGKESLSCEVLDGSI